MNTKRILIIEDDSDAANVLEAYLRRENFEVQLAADGPRGLQLALSQRPDLILLDMMLPGMTGIEILSTLRRTSDVPVIIVTAMGDAPDRIGALRFGADDYVVKPYHPGEVVARVQAVLRRSNPSRPAQVCRRVGPVELDRDTMMVTVVRGDTTLSLELTPTEFSLLDILMARPTSVFSRQTLLECCMPESEALERVVDTHIYNLRRKLENAGVSGTLRSVRSIGYRYLQP
jgi:two-component system, OmpR family, response regulator AdeR